MTFLALGLGLFVLGSSFKLNPVSAQEVRVILALQKWLAKPPRLSWFQEIWFFGRTVFAVFALLSLTGFNWKLGLSALVVFGATAGIESLLKAIVKRQRPFQTHPEVQMAQPQQPSDPSFPSGDAMRIWFLALIFLAASGGSPAFGSFAILLAGMVSVGRMILGVHYPTDVLAGTGLGLIGAGTTIWLWQSFNLL